MSRNRRMSYVVCAQAPSRTASHRVGEAPVASYHRRDGRSGFHAWPFARRMVLSRVEGRGRCTRTQRQNERAPRRQSMMANPDRRLYHRKKSGESFTTSRHLNIIRQFCERGLVVAVMFDMVCTSRQAGWYGIGPCCRVTVEIAWDHPPDWHSGIGTLAGDHSLPQRTPMDFRVDHGGFCVAGVV